MIKINKKVVSRVITVIVLALFVWYFLSHLADFKILLHIEPLLVAALVLCYVTSFVTNGLFMKWSISLFGKNISIIESIRVTLISSAGNFFAPAGSGLAFRAVYLKRKHSLAYSDYVAITFCNYVIVFFMSAILGAVALYQLDGRFHYPASLLLMVFFVIIICASFLTFFVRMRSRPAFLSSSPLRRRIGDTLVGISNGWRLIIQNRGFVLGLVLIVLANMLIGVLAALLIMYSLSISLSFAGVVLYSVLGSFSLFVNITPGNLGIKEVVFVIFSSVIGLTTVQILSAALVDRAVLFSVLAVLWIFFGRRFYSTSKNPSS